MVSQPLKAPDGMVLAALDTALKQDDIDEGAMDPWLGSPFAWIRTMRSRRIGKLGEQLVAGWCAANGFDVVASPSANADRIIARLWMAIKFSTRWESGTFTFQTPRRHGWQRTEVR